ncbi:MAG: hypothetical protein EA402_00015, partial [Planctomycetota bacterium]
FALQKNLALSITAPVGKSFSHRLAAEANFYTSPGTEITVPSEKETGSKKGASIAFWLKIPLVSQESAAMSQEIEMTTMGVEGGVAEIEGSDTEMRSSTLDIHDALSKLQSVDNSISTSAAEVE